MSDQLARFLYRPIVFQAPDRLVPPPSWVEHIPFAFWLIDVLRPRVFVELGTQSGNSYAAFAQAIQSLGLPTAAYAVDTWEGDQQAGFYGGEVFAEWSAYHERQFSAFSRLLRSTFSDASRHFPDGSVDLLHIDGCHTYDAVSADFTTWKPKLSPRSIVLFHDINVRERDFGSWKLWNEIKGSGFWFEFLHGHGLGVLALGRELPEPLEWLLTLQDRQPDAVQQVRTFFSRLGSVNTARLAMAEAEAEAAAAARTAAALQAELDAARSAAAELDRELQSAASERDARATEADSARREIAGLRERLDEANTRLGDRERALAEKTQLCALLQEQVWRATQGVAAAHDTPAQGRGGRLRGRVTAARLRRALGGARRHLQAIAGAPVAAGLLPVPRRWGLVFLRNPARLRDAAAVLRSGLFDERYYRTTNPDVAAAGINPLAHFLLRGGREGRNPHPLFDCAYYLRANPDVASSQVNPLAHYVRLGAFEGRNPHPLFDTSYYRASNPDVLQANVEPLRHFLMFGARDGRNPNPFFDCHYYLSQNGDVRESQVNPLLHYVTQGWREGRRPSKLFDPQAYAAANPDIRAGGGEPLAHYLEFGRAEGRPLGEPVESEAPGPAAVEARPVVLNVRAVVRRETPRPTVLCLSHVMPISPRAGNEYRIYRLLRWLRDQGYRVVPVIAPLPGVHIEASAVADVANEFSSAVLCDRSGRVDYVLDGVPDALALLDGDLTRPVAALLAEDADPGPEGRRLLEIDRAFCHDALVSTVLRLQQALGPHLLLAEYIWMARILPLTPRSVPKIIDTIDVFSSKHEKVTSFGIDDVYVPPEEEARRLRGADLVVAIQEDERRALQRLVPKVPVVTAGVDFDVVADPGVPTGRRVLYVASDNPMNRKGLTDFLRFAWPQIRREVPDAQLVIVGPVGDTLQGEFPGVSRAGRVENLLPLYRDARLIINPAVAGTGLKIKTIEALGHLRPIVTWPNGVDGIAPELAALCTVARDWFEFARSAIALLSPDTPILFSDRDRDTIVRHTSPSLTYGPLTDAMRGLWERRFGAFPEGLSGAAATRTA